MSSRFHLFPFLCIPDWRVTQYPSQTYRVSILFNSGLDQHTVPKDCLGGKQVPQKPGLSQNVTDFYRILFTYVN